MSGRRRVFFPPLCSLHSHSAGPSQGIDFIHIIFLLFFSASLLSMFTLFSTSLTGSHPASPRPAVHTLELSELCCNIIHLVTIIPCSVMQCNLSVHLLCILLQFTVNSFLPQFSPALPSRGVIFTMRTFFLPVYSPWRF